MLQDWVSVTIQGLQNLWIGFLNFIPMFLGALIVFIVGWFLSVLAGKVVTEILKRIKFNQFFEKGNWQNALKKAEIDMDAAGFIGAIVKWILLIVFLQIAVGILGWTEFSVILSSVVAYLPNVIIATLIFVVAIVLADILEKVVVATAEGTKFLQAKLAGAIAKWAIWIFATLVILRQLMIAPVLVETLFSAIVYGVVAIFVIAFGLGGKEVAAEALRDLKRKFKQ